MGLYGAISHDRILHKHCCENLISYIMLPVALYGFGIRSLIPREETRLRVFQNKVLRRIFRVKREEEMEG
jgi:hypothetical protein